MRLASALIGLVLLGSTVFAGDIRVRVGSWYFHDPFKLYNKADPQVVSIVGGRQFTFNGVSDVFQLNAATCFSATPYYPNCDTNWSLAFAIGGTISGYVYPGVGMLGTATLDGVSYTHVGLPNSTERLYFYAIDPYATIPIPAVSSTPKTRYATFPLLGFFHHNGIVENIFDSYVQATVVFENYQGKMVPESIKYTIVVP